MQLDSIGNSGGCKGIYAMIPPPGTTTPPTCPNVTFPAGAMDVVAEEQDGRLSQFGWIRQVPPDSAQRPGKSHVCSAATSRSPPGMGRHLTPLRSTPISFSSKFTLTLHQVSPALLPLYFIRSNTMATINWTVSIVSRILHPTHFDAECR